MVVARGAENILPTAWRRRRGGHSGGLNAMIDGLHHKLATIGAPSRLLQQPSFPEKKTRAPIHFPCLFVDSPAKLVTTYILLSRQLYSSPICYFFLHNRGMYYVVLPNCIIFGFTNPTIQYFPYFFFQHSQCKNLCKEKLMEESKITFQVLAPSTRKEKNKSSF